MIGSRRQWPSWVLFGVFATVVATSAFDYSVLVPRPDLRYAMHRAIVDGSAPSPQRFRVLVPWSLDPIIRLAGRAGDGEQVFRRVYFVFHFLALSALVGGVYAYSRLWFSCDQSLIGALVVASVLHLVLRMGEYWDFSPIPDRTWFAPWSLIEPAFVALGLLFLASRRFGALAILTVIASLNSEAAVLLPLLALVVPNSGRRDGLILLGLWASVTLLLRFTIGGFTMPETTWHQNLAHLPHIAVNLLLFLGPAAALVVAGYRRAPLFARRAAMALVPLVIALAIFADWWDVRLLTPAYPIIAPLLLAGLGLACQADVVAVDPAAGAAN